MRFILTPLILLVITTPTKANENQLPSNWQTGQFGLIQARPVNEIELMQLGNAKTVIKTKHGFKVERGNKIPVPVFRD